MSKGPNPPMPLPTEEEQTRGPIPSDLAIYRLNIANAKRKALGLPPLDDWRDAEVGPATEVDGWTDAPYSPWPKEAA